MLVKKQNINSPPGENILKNKSESYKQAFNDGYDFCKRSGNSSLYNEGFEAGKSFNAEYIQAIGSNWFKETNTYCPSHYQTINECINNPRYREERIENFGEYDGTIIADCIDIIKSVIDKSLMKISHQDMMIDSQLLANNILFLSSLTLGDRIKITEVNKKINEQFLDNIMNKYEQTSPGGVLCSGDGNLKQDEDAHSNDGGMKKDGEGMDGSDDYWNT